MPAKTKPDPGILSPDILSIDAIDAALARGRTLRSKAYYEFGRTIVCGMISVFRAVFNHGSLCQAK